MSSTEALSQDITNSHKPPKGYSTDMHDQAAAEPASSEAEGYIEAEEWDAATVRQKMLLASGETHE